VELARPDSDCTKPVIKITTQTLHYLGGKQHNTFMGVSAVVTC